MHIIITSKSVPVKLIKFSLGSCDISVVLVEKKDTTANKNDNIPRENVEHEKWKRSSIADIVYCLDSKQKHPGLHTSERTFVPQTVIFTFKGIFQLALIAFLTALTALTAFLTAFQEANEHKYFLKYDIKIQ